METSKEELQSLNEELTTVNAELEEKVDELERTHNDLDNLLASTHIATLFFDRDSASGATRPPPPACSTWSPRTSGGRWPISPISFPMVTCYPTRQQVLDTLTPNEPGAHGGGRVVPPAHAALSDPREPHRGRGGDLHRDHRAEAGRGGTPGRPAATPRALWTTVREPLLVLDDQLRVVSAGRSFYRTFGVTADETVGRQVYRAGRAAVGRSAAAGAAGGDPAAGHQLRGLRSGCTRLGHRAQENAAECPTRSPARSARPRSILLAIEDVTERAPGRTPVPEVGS